MMKSTTRLPVGEILTTAWEKVYGVKRFFFCGMIVIGLVNHLMHHVNQSIEHHAANPLWLSVLVIIFLFLISTLVGAALQYMGIKRSLGMPVSFDSYQKVFDLSMMAKIVGWNIVLVMLFFVCSMLGFFTFFLLASFINGYVAIIFSFLYILLVMYLALRVFLVTSIILMQNAKPTSAIKLSWNATNGYALKIAFFLMLIFTIVVISALPLGIGLIWSFAWVMIILGEIYKRIVVDPVTINQPAINKL